MAGRRRPRRSNVCRPAYAKSRWMPTPLSELQALEIELHHPGVRSASARLEQLLHAAFHEVGRSGRKYDRNTVLAFLAQESERPAIESDGFAVELLADDLALLSYRSAHRLSNGTLANHTHRVSLWQRTSAGWQVRYHQGTPAAEPW